MKKLFLFGALLLTVYSNSQTIVLTSEQQVMPSNWSAYFEKYIPWFDHFDFCGQVSDPSMHPEFDKILELVAKNNKSADVHNTASQRPERWYRKMFDISSGTKIAWRFGIDGLPKDSHKYRTRQDGQKLFDMMSIAAEYNPGFEICWKYCIECFSTIIQVLA